MFIQDHPFFNSKSAAPPDYSEYVKKQEQINALRNVKDEASFSKILSESNAQNDKSKELSQQAQSFSAANPASLTSIVNMENASAKNNLQSMPSNMARNLAQNPRLAYEANLSDTNAQMSPRMLYENSKNPNLANPTLTTHAFDKTVGSDNHQTQSALQAVLDRVNGKESQKNESSQKALEDERLSIQVNQNPVRGIALNTGIELLNKRPIGIRPVAISLDNQSLQTLSRLETRQAQGINGSSSVRGSFNQGIPLHPQAPIDIDGRLSGTPQKSENDEIASSKIENNNNKTSATSTPLDKVNARLEKNNNISSKEAAAENTAIHLKTTEFIAENLSTENPDTKTIIKENPLGALSAKYESGGKGIEAIGYDRVGGTSYGKYQIASNVGTFDRFVAYLQDEAPDIASQLEKGGKANTGSRKGAMPEIWKEIAANEPARFHDLQEGFIKKTHYDPAFKAVEDSKLDTNSKIIQQVVWSTSVHHGAKGAERILDRAISSLGLDKIKEGEELPKDIEKQFITTVYDIRSRQFGSSSEHVRNAVQNRLVNEKNDALRALG